MEFEFIPAKIKPKETGHYLVISYPNMYHGGCYDKGDDGTTISYYVAYYDRIFGFNVPHVAAWCRLPDFPEVYKKGNLEFLNNRDKERKNAGKLH